MNIAFCLMKHDYILQNKNVARGGAFCGFARILSGMMGESIETARCFFLLLRQVGKLLEKPYIPSGE